MWFRRNAGLGKALSIFKSARVSELPRLCKVLLAAPSHPYNSTFPFTNQREPSVLFCLREQAFVALPSRLMPQPTLGTLSWMKTDDWVTIPS
uniref:Uncharacterized protein n=1 Tax=Sciurus vulgaris TaxID=55149 RepID=A0A8D2BDV8_SCIVU